MWLIAAVLLVSIANCFAMNCKNNCTVIGNYCYDWITSILTNNDAQSLCYAAGGQLPFFNYNTDFIQFYNLRAQLNFTYAWLGYWNYYNHSGTNPGIWRSSNGTGLTAPFTTWYPGQPDLAFSTEFCAQTWFNQSWNDITCVDPTSWWPSNTICMCLCQPLAPITNGITTSPQDFGYVGSSTTFTCNQGYKLMGIANINCVKIGNGLGWNNIPPYCQRLQCSDWFNRATGSVQPAPYWAGVNVTFTCLNNFILSDGSATSKMYHCQIVDGSWLENSFIPCIGTCPVLPGFANGSVNETVVLGRVMVGTKALFSCNTNFELVGSSNSSCLPNGTWSNQQPFCRITCPMIGDLTGGIVIQTALQGRVSIGSSAVFYCNADIELVGTNQSSCLPNGTWSNDVPFCTMTCPSISNFTNGIVKQTEFLGRVYAGSRALFYCNVEFDLVGTEDLYCLMNGTWSNVEPYCEEANMFWWWPFILGFALCLCNLILLGCLTKRTTSAPPKRQFSYSGKVF